MSANFNFYLNRQGAQGRQGEQGEAGYSPTISVDTNTAAEYKLRIQNETTSFITPNLRGNAIEDTGGTYVRYNPTTQMFETGFIDQATPSSIGGVLITPVGGLEAGGTDVDVPTSAEVYDFVLEKIQEAEGEGLTYDELKSTLVEGNNIVLTPDDLAKTITIGASIDLSDYVTTNTTQTVLLNGISKTFSSSGNGTLVRDSGFYFNQGGYTGTLSIGVNQYGGVKRGGLIARDGLGVIIGTQGAENKSSSIFIPYNCDNPIILKGLNRPEPLSTSEVDAGYPIWNESIVSAGPNILINTIGTGRNRTYELSAVQPDLSNYVTLDTQQTITGRKGFTSEILASGGITLPTGNSINFHSPTTGSSGIISSPSANTLQLRANTINISSGGSTPIIKNLFDMVQLSDLSIASTSSNWLNYNNGTGEFSANVDTVATQNSNNLITSDAVYDGLAAKQDTITDLSSIRSGAELGSTSEQLENKVSSIDGTSSDTEYPSAKCVYDNLETKADKSQTHALKSYSDEGELLTDAEGLADVTKYAHSTFDLSKFTVVGSPNITDDGILSTTSSSNYIKTPSILLGNNWDIIIPLKGATVRSSSAETLLRSSSSYANCSIGIAYSRMEIFLRDINNTGISVAYPKVSGSTFTQIANVTYLMKLSCRFDGTNYTITAYASNDDGATWASGAPTVTTSIPYVAQNYESWQIQPYRMTSDSVVNLKQFSITVDGVEVFSGNKTGIDTIKPDDYTVVGAPVISADGIASGFGAYTTYIQTPIKASELLNKSWEIHSVVNGNGYGWCVPVCFTQNNYGDISSNITTRFGVNNVYFNLKTGDSEGTSQLKYNDSYKFNIGDYKSQTCEVVLAFDYPTGIYSYYFIDETGNKRQEKTYTPTSTNKQLYEITSTNNYIAFGGGINAGSYNTNTQFDLNSFKIYVDGNLVYQPCLKIPYTESKTGSKIVNATYRDRVNDMAEQFGYANYYTLSDTDFTLPKGELYGLIGDKTLRDSYYNGVTYWELFSNRRLEQGGSCESGVEYTFPKPFADRNYVLTIPYSSKTATSFIPSATGDFIAKGMGLL